MSIFSYHLISVSYMAALRIMLSPLKPNKIKGLIHSETMSAMRLGSSIFSQSRFFNRDIVLFAQWEDESSIDEFLKEHSIGSLLNKGWYLRLKFIRQWGNISGFKISEKETETLNDNEPVVAVTVARMKYSQIPRFLSWGRPVEQQVRDNTETTLSLASIRYPNTISTFSIWKTQKAMYEMVFGHSKMPQPKRHINAMKERNRKDFHFEFTTLRFTLISEHGIWNNRSNYFPSNQK